MKTLPIKNIWKFATFNLYTVPEKILYLQRYSTDFRNLRLTSKILSVAIWVESFRRAGILLLQWQGENFAHRQHLKVCHFQPVHCASKNPISPKVFNRFSTSLPQLEDFEGGHLGVKFQVRRYFTFATESENFANRQHLKVCHFQPVHCASKNPIFPKVFDRFSKSFPQLEDFEGGHLGGKLQVRMYFTFSMARWELCAWTTFESLPHSTCTLGQQKSHISKGIQPIFEIFRSARRLWGWAFVWKASGAQVFHFSNGKVRILRIDNIWKFATFNMYTVPAKILYLQRYSTDFRNRCLTWTILRVGICVGSFKIAGILILQWQGENFAHRQHLKVCHVQPVHCARKNSISPKVFNRVSIYSPHLEDFERGNLGEKFQARRYFTFLIARWQLCASTTFESLPLSTCTLCQQKSYISKGIQPIFEIFASIRRCWGWALGCKTSGVQVFYFLNGKVRTFRIDNIWNFATFNLHTVPAKMLYLQRYSTDFRHLCISSKMLMVEPGAECFRCAGILLLQWQGENSALREFLKFCHFRPGHCGSKNPISPKVFNRFSRSLHQFEDVESGHRGGKFQVRRYFTLAMARWKLFASTTYESLPLSTCTLCKQKSCISKGIKPIFETLSHFEDVVGGHWGGKFQVHRHFTFAMARWKLFASTIFEILPLSTCTLCQQKSYISKDIQPILEIFSLIRRFWRWAFLWENTFAMARWKLCPSTTFESLPLSTCTQCQQKSYISKGIQPIFDIFASVRRCWGWALMWKVSGAQVFYFWNGMVKTLPIDNMWKFATFNLYSVPAKILYLQRNSTHFRNLCLSSKILRVCISVESFRCAGILLLQWQGENSSYRQYLNFLPHSTCTLCQPKSYISQDIQPILEILALIRSFWGWAFRWKVSGSQVFYFCNGKGKILLIENIWKFATFNMYTLRAKILYLQRYSTDFRNLCLSSKMLRVGIGVENFRRGGILLLQWQCENFVHRQHLKVCHFQPVHCASKNGISPKVFNRFSTCLPQLDDFEGGNLGVKFQVRRYFTFAMARWKLCPSTTFESLPCSTCTLCQKKSYISKGIQPIFEIFASTRRFWVSTFGWKVSGAQVF